MNSEGKRTQGLYGGVLLGGTGSGCSWLTVPWTNGFKEWDVQKITIWKASAHKPDKGFLQLYSNEVRESSGAYHCEVFLSVFQKVQLFYPKLLDSHCPLPFPIGWGTSLPNRLPHTLPLNLSFNPKVQKLWIMLFVCFSSQTVWVL